MTKLKSISLFSGVGGLDFGFESAGFETRVALDLDRAACSALRSNRPWPVLEGDIAHVTSKQLLKTAGLRVGEADILFGGPPCQPFSKSGYWATGDAKRLDDPRAQTLSQFLRVVHETMPKVFLIENVTGLAYSGKSEALEFIRRRVQRINAETGSQYVLSVQAMNAADFGVPQLRERVVIVGSRDGKTFRFPTATHGTAGHLETHAALAPYRTAWEAFAGLPEHNTDPSLRLTGKWADLLPTIPEGQNYLWHTDRGGGAPLFGWRTRYWSFLLKLAKNQPSWTIQAQPGPATGPFHWRNRKLSVAELARLQTLPDDLIFDCARGDAQRLIGNAVPSLLAEALAREIKVQLLGKRRAQTDLALATPSRRKPPPPEKPARVPAKYRHLIGEHDDHPGAGKGRGAVSRQRLERAA